MGTHTLHSTVTCLLKNTDDRYNGLGNGQLIGLIPIGLKKLLTPWITQHSVSKIRALWSPKKGIIMVQILHFKSKTVL